MKKITIEGEIGAEIKKQLTQVDSLLSTINDMSQTRHELAKRMWAQVKKEYPDTSDNCSLSIEDGKVLLVDRLGD